MGDSDIKSELAGISATLKGMAGTLEKIDVDIRSVKQDHQGILKTVTEHKIKIENIEKDVQPIWNKIRDTKKEAIQESFDKVKMWLYGAIILGLMGGGSLVEKILSALR